MFEKGYGKNRKNGSLKSQELCWETGDDLLRKGHRSVVSRAKKEQSCEKSQSKMKFHQNKKNKEAFLENFRNVVEPFERGFF